MAFDTKRFIDNDSWKEMFDAALLSKGGEESAKEVFQQLLSTKLTSCLVAISDGLRTETSQDTLQVLTDKCNDITEIIQHLLYVKKVKVAWPFVPGFMPIQLGSTISMMDDKAILFQHYDHRKTYLFLQDCLDHLANQKFSNHELIAEQKVRLAKLHPRFMGLQNRVNMELVQTLRMPAKSAIKHRPKKKRK